MVEMDIAAPPGMSKRSVPALAQSPFELWATQHSHNIAPAVPPSDTRIYADRQTQAAFDAWSAGAANVAQMLTKSTIETEAFRECVKRLAE